MKVRITKNNDENYWYNDRIGEVFEVEEARHSLYYRANGRYKRCYIDKDDCEIIKENPLEGADKLSKQIITSEWAKMPKVKEETVKKKQYVVVKPIMGVPAEEIKIRISPCYIGVCFSLFNKDLTVFPEYIPELLSKGIIAEKKSKAEEVTDKIIYRLEEDNQAVFLKKAEQAKQIILQELEKAGIE